MSIRSLVFAIIVVPSFAFAQYNAIVSEVALTMDPQMPHPGDTVSLTVQGLIRPDTRVNWSIDGKPVFQSTGPILTMTAGPLGTETEIDAVLQTDTGPQVASATIRPTELDLLWSSDSYVPPFFGGRALPSAGSSIRAEAVPRFKKGSTVISSSDLVYSWKRNDATLSTASGRGRSHAVFPAPVLFGSDVIAVDVASLDGTLHAHAETQIRSVDTHLSVYQDHPLFGVLFNAALDAQFSSPDKELSLIAVPYYATQGVLYHWGVNGAEAAPSPKTPARFTLHATEPSSADISLSLSSEWNPFEAASRVWHIDLLHSSQR